MYYTWEGYKGFEDGDVLRVNGEVKAHVKHMDGAVYLTFEDKYESRMYLGKVDSPVIDDCINIAWSTLCLQW